MYLASTVENSCYEATWETSCQTSVVIYIFCCINCQFFSDFIFNCTTEQFYTWIPTGHQPHELLRFSVKIQTLILPYCQKENLRTRLREFLASQISSTKQLTELMNNHTYFSLRKPFFLIYIKFCSQLICVYCYANFSSSHFWGIARTLLSWDHLPISPYWASHNCS